MIVVGSIPNQGKELFWFPCLGKKKLNSATQNATLGTIMLDGVWGTECFNICIPLPMLLYEG